MSQWAKWYSTYRWQKLRLRQLQAEPLCRMCTEEGRTTAANVCDHITPHKGDPVAFWQGPFQSLCQSHHNRDKQSMENGGRRMHRLTFGTDGWPT